MFTCKHKRLLGLTLAVCTMLSLAACGSEPEVPELPEPDQTIVTPAEPEAPAEPEVPAEPVAPAEPETDPDLFVAEGNVNPLTGLCDGIPDEALTHRPIAVMVNNMKTSLPQWGVSQADIIYEMLAEGRITRFLAIFQDYSKIDRLASIRSARPYFIDMAQSYGAVYIHFGGSVPAYEAINSRKDLININGIKGKWEGTVFFRDPDRRKEMGYEHSVYTTGEYLQDAMNTLTDKGYDLSQTEHPSAFRFGERWSDNAAAEGQPANKITVTFSGRHKPWFQYDESTGKYLRFQYGDPQMDGWKNQQIAVDNVFVLCMKLHDVPDSDLHLVEVKTTGEGEGFYFREGRYVPITWKKDKYNSEIEFFDANGDELVVGRGQTFVSVVADSSKIAIE